MPTIVAAVVLPLLITVLFMFALRPVARGVGLIDRPGGRKMHEGEIPVIGGVAMFLGLGLGGIYNLEALHNYYYFLAALSILVVIGAVDDRYDLPPTVRFLAQVCAAFVLLAGADLSVIDLGKPFFGEAVQLGWLSTPFTLTIVLTAINALNMFDGSDGVAGTQSLIALMFMGLACLVAGTMQYLPIILCLGACLLGFLIFNWPSRRTQEIRAFMGDAGSTMLGFSLAWLCIELSQEPVRVFSPVVALWIFALPIYDFFSSMVRRVLMGKSPFHGDSEHLHHVLRRLGLRSRQVAQLILVSASVLAAIGVGGHQWGVPDGALFVAWLLLGTVYYVVFASGRVIKRREEAQEGDESPTGVHPTLWRQR